ncbi:MAG TPA: SDR family oxidoreductase [Ramlibacter sp.]|nr:SDR family oxidoreductase [Ramlibacter sp.]
MGERLKDKVVLVVGASSGIGRAIALRFAEEGAIVTATGTSGRQDDLAGRHSGRPIFPMHCDIADQGSVQRVVDDVMRRHGSLDVVVNSAGIGIARKRLHEVEPEEWDRLMAVNLRGSFLLLRAALPAMMASGGGSVILVASVSSYRATAMAGPYAASKGGVLQLARAAALEYAADGIRVNALCPGTTETPLVQRHPPEFLAPLKARIPLGRLASPDEIANLALFLASDEASYVTGQGYVIDGGRFAG